MALVRRLMGALGGTPLGQAMTRQLGAPRGPLGWVIGRGLASGNRETIRWIVHELDPGPAHAVLEVGCGPAVGVPEVLSRARAGSYDGVDPSPTMLAQARRRNRMAVAAGRARLHDAFAHDLPFPDARFDAAFAVNVVYFWDDPVVELSEIRRVLAPGARFVLGARPRDRMEPEPREQFEDAGHRTYTVTQLECFLSDAGFVDVATTSDEAGYAAVRASVAGARPTSPVHVGHQHDDS